VTNLSWFALGDNLLINCIKQFIKRFEEGDADTMVLLAKVSNPQRFGMAKFDSEIGLLA